MIDDWEERKNTGESDKKRKIIPVFFIIDLSGSMSGKEIDILNNTMDAIMKDLFYMTDNTEFEINYAVLSFGSECKWETGDTFQVCSGEWKRLTAEGLTYFNTACRKLNEKLSSENGFFDFETDKLITSPIIILLTDGYAFDGDPYGMDGIKELRKNEYFKRACKLAIAIERMEGRANKELCENFTGNPDLVFVAYNAKVLKNHLNTVFKESVSKNMMEFDSNSDINKVDIEKIITAPDFYGNSNSVDQVDWD